MTGVGAHGLEDESARTLADARLAVPFPLDAIECPHRLAQREGHGGADFQDREVIAYQSPQSLLGLVVGGVRLEYEIGYVGEAAAEVTRLLRPIFDDPVVIELHSGLHHQTDDSVPGVLQGLALAKAAR